jgi:hypothetical protein
MTSLIENERNYHEIRTHEESAKTAKLLEENTTPSRSLYDNIVVAYSVIYNSICNLFCSLYIHNVIAYTAIYNSLRMLFCSPIDEFQMESSIHLPKTVELPPTEPITKGLSSLPSEDNNEDIKNIGQQYEQALRNSQPPLSETEITRRLETFCFFFDIDIHPLKLNSDAGNVTPTSNAVTGSGSNATPPTAETEDDIIKRIVTALVDNTQDYDKIIKNVESIILGTTVLTSKNFYVKLLSGLAATVGLTLNASITKTVVDNFFPIVFGTTDSAKVGAIVHEFMRNNKRKKFMEVAGYLAIPFTTDSHLTVDRLKLLYERVRDKEDFPSMIAALADAETYLKQAFSEYARSRTLVGFAIDKVMYRELIDNFHVLNLEKERVKRDPGYVAKWNDILVAASAFTNACCETRRVETDNRIVEAINRMEIAILELTVTAKARTRMGKLQTAPYAFVVSGPTGVGKTEPQTFLGKLIYYIMHGKDIADEEKVNIRADSKFPAITNLTRLLIMDDINNKIVSDTGESALDLVNQAVNNVPWYVNAAEAQDKNKIVPKLDVVAASTNSTDMQAGAVTIEPGSALRRFHMHIRVVPRERYRKSRDELQLDASKVIDGLDMPDTHLFTVQKVVMAAVEPPVQDTFGKAVKHQPADYRFETIWDDGEMLQNISLHRLVKYLQKEVPKYVAHQERFVAKANASAISSLCLDCAKHKENCQCLQNAMPLVYNTLASEIELGPRINYSHEEVLTSIDEMWTICSCRQLTLWNGEWAMAFPLALMDDEPVRTEHSASFVTDGHRWCIVAKEEIEVTMDVMLAEAIVVTKPPSTDLVQVSAMNSLNRRHVLLALSIMGEMTRVVALDLADRLDESETTPHRLVLNSYLANFTPDDHITYTAFQRPRAKSLFKKFRKTISLRWMKKKFTTFFYGGRTELGYEMSLAFGYDPDSNNVYFRLYRMFILCLQVAKETRIFHPAVYLPACAGETEVKACVSALNEDELTSKAWWLQTKRAMRNIVSLVLCSPFGPFALIPYVLYRSRRFCSQTPTTMTRVFDKVRTTFSPITNSPDHLSRIKIVLTTAAISSLAFTAFPIFHLTMAAYSIMFLPFWKSALIVNGSILGFDYRRWCFLVGATTDELRKNETDKIMALRSTGITSTLMQSMHMARMVHLVATNDTASPTFEQVDPPPANTTVSLVPNVSIQGPREFYETTEASHSKKGEYIMTQDQLQRVVERNVAHLRYEDKDSMLYTFVGIFVSTGLLLIPAHAARENVVLHCTTNVHSDGTPYKFTTMLDIRSARTVAPDALLVPVERSGPFRDIRRLFAPGHVSWPAELVRARKTRDGLPITERGVVTDRNAMGKVEHGSHKYAAHGAMYSAPPSVSFSGSPVFSVAQPMIYGLHVAQSQQQSFAMRVTRESLYGADFPDHPAPLSIGDYMSSVPLHDKNIVDKTVTSADEATILGYMGRPVEPKDSWIKSSISDELALAGLPPTHGSPYAGNAPMDGKVNYLSAAARKVEKTLCPLRLKAAAQDYWSPFHPRAVEKSLRPLTIGEVVNGTANSAWCSGAEMSTAMNFPFTGTKKEWAVQKNGKWFLKGEVHTAYDEVCRLLLKNDMPALIVYLKNKMEQRVFLYDGVSKKPRQYCAVPFLLNMLISKYFDPIWGLVFDDPITGEALVGINPHDERHVRRVIKAMENCDINSIDYKHFDMSANSQAIKAYLMEMINVAADGTYTESDLRMMRAIVTMILRPLINVDGAVTAFENVVPSGITGTSFIDGGVSSILKRYYFLGYYPKIPFRSAVQLLTYGDDNTEGRKKLLGFIRYPKYTPEGYAAFVNSIGMTVTGATKSKDITKGIDIISRKFLKVKVCGRIRAIAPLKKESILKSLHGHIKKTGTDYDAVLQDNITRAFMEMILHGPAELEAFRAVLLRIENPLVKHHRIITEMLSYRQLWSLYDDFASNSIESPTIVTLIPNANIPEKLGKHESKTTIAAVPTAVLKATGKFAAYVSTNAPRAILAAEKFLEVMGYVAMALGNSRPNRIDAPPAMEIVYTPRLSNFNAVDNVKKLSWDVRQGLAELKSGDTLYMLEDQFRRWSYLDYVETTSLQNVNELIWSMVVDPKVSVQTMARGYGWGQANRPAFALTNLAAAATPFTHASGSIEIRLMAFAPMSVTFTAKITFDPHASKVTSPPLNTQHTYLWNISDDPVLDIKVNNGTTTPFAEMSRGPNYVNHGANRTYTTRNYGFGTLSIYVFDPVNAMGTTTADYNSLCFAVYIRGGSDLQFMGTSPQWEEVMPVLRPYANAIAATFNYGFNEGVDSSQIEYDGTQTTAPTYDTVNAPPPSDSPSPTSNSTQPPTLARRLKKNAYEWEKSPKPDIENPQPSIQQMTLVAIICNAFWSFICIGCLNMDWSSLITRAQNEVRRRFLRSPPPAPSFDEVSSEQIYIPPLHPTEPTQSLKRSKGFRTTLRPNGEVTDIPTEETEAFLTHDTFLSHTDDSASLDKWLSRDIVLHQSKLVTNSFSCFTLDPMSKFLSDGFIRDKLAYAHSMRATMVFEIIIGESRVQSAGVMVTYLPYMGDEMEHSFTNLSGDDTAYYTTQKMARITLLSNPDHVVVSPQFTRRVTYKVPFFFDKEFMFLTDNEPITYGRLHVTHLVPVREVGERTGIPSLPFTILMHLEDVELKGVTSSPMPILPVTINAQVELNENHSVAAQLPLIYGGESIVSMKQLMKRSTQLFMTDPSSGPGVTELQFPALPPYPGFSTHGGSHRYNLKWYNAVRMTPFTYFRSMYAGVRGSMKYMIFRHSACSSCPSSIHRVSLTDNFAGITKETASNADSTMLSDLDDDTKYFTGTEISIENNPVTHIEIPHQTNKLFQRSRNTTKPITYLNVVYRVYNADGPAQEMVYFTPGEDVQFVGYVGPPLMTLGHWATSSGTQPD